jgi:hypothetical protein
MRSVTDRNVVLRHQTVIDVKFQALKAVTNIIVDVIPYGLVHVIISTTPLQFWEVTNLNHSFFFDMFI